MASSELRIGNKIPQENQFVYTSATDGFRCSVRPDICSELFKTLEGVKSHCLGVQGIDNSGLKVNQVCGCDEEADEPDKALIIEEIVTAEEIL